MTAGDANSGWSVATLSRRAAIGALAAGGAAFALFGPRGSKDSRSGGRIVLDYWEKWTGHEGVAMRRVVDEFNSAQNRIYVRYFSMGGIGEKSLVAIAGNSPPDIIGLWNFNIPAFAEAGALVPLDELAAEFGITRERYAAPVWPLGTHRDRLWGLVSTCGSVALYYNRALFREAGLDPGHAPETIDELDAFAARLTKAGPDGRLERAGFLHTEPGWWTWLWGYPFGGSLYDPAADRATAADAANIAGYEWVRSYPERYGADNLLRFQSGLGTYGSPEHPFLTGQVAMTIQGPWLANNIVEFKPDLDYAVAPFPTARAQLDRSAPIGLLDADVLVLPRGSPHPREAFEFIAFTQQQRVVEQLARAHCKNSPLAESTEDFVANHPNRFVGVHNELARSPRAFRFPRTRTWPEYEDEFRSGFQRLWGLRSSAAEMLGTIQSRAQEQLDRAADMRRRRGAGGVRA